MALTVAERSHWKDRIEARIDRRIEAITAGEPGLIERIRQEARGPEAARIARPGGVPRFRPDRRLACRCRTAGTRRSARRCSRASAACRPTSSTATPACTTTPEIRAAITRRQALHEEELLAGHELGRQVLRLRAERENLLDVIWLATSPVQVRQLWTKVAELLGEEPTHLEREALSIPPAGEEG